MARVRKRPAPEGAPGVASELEPEMEGEPTPDLTAQEPEAPVEEEADRREGGTSELALHSTDQSVPGDRPGG